jgi:hypothetical protein
MEQVPGKLPTVVKRPQHEVPCQNYRLRRVEFHSPKRLRIDVLKLRGTFYYSIKINDRKNTMWKGNRKEAAVAYLRHGTRISSEGRQESHKYTCQYMLSLEYKADIITLSRSSTTALNVIMIMSYEQGEH